MQSAQASPTNSARIPGDAALVRGFDWLRVIDMALVEVWTP
jgi:hypothetical protein